MSKIGRLRLLPVLLLVAVLSFSIRMGEFFHGLSSAGSAQAQQEVRTDVPPLPTTTQETTIVDTGEEILVEQEVTMDREGEVYLERPMVGEENSEVWQDAADSDYIYSEVREELYEDLAERRQELIAREKALATREALLEAAERELGQKVRELTAVRNEIEALLEQQSEEEKARIQSLVRIYEGMKAGDAARIFNTLDMDVLIRVMAQMSERKSAPILAEMSPERARSVTILLAQQKQIPSIPPQ